MQESFVFSIVMIFIAVVFLVITLAYVIVRAFSRQAGEICGWELRGARARIAAVARITLAEGVRARVASGFAVIILVAVPLFWWKAVGDGTIKGQVQMFITYSMGFAGFMLSLLTIFFSCRSLSVEIASRQIYALATKPVPRWQILAGKWLGVMFFNVVIIGVVAGATYAGTMATLSSFKERLAQELQSYGGLTPDQAVRSVAALDHVKGIGKQGAESPIVGVLAETLGQTTEQVVDMLIMLPEATRVDLRRFDELRRQILVARAWVSPPLPDFREEVDRRYKQLVESGDLPEDASETRIREQLEIQVFADFCAVPPGYQARWKFQGPQPQMDGDFIMSVQFQIQVPEEMQAATVMGLTLEKDTLLCAWGVGNPERAEFYQVEEPFPVRTINEFEIPVKCIEEDGTIWVSFINLDPRRGVAVFDLPDALQVLYRVGSFGKNVLCAALALLIPITCLTSFGVLASTFLSFPVGSLILVTMYVLSISMAFVAESFAATTEYAPPDPGVYFEIRKAAIDAVDWALYMGDVDAVRKLIEGRAVGWPLLWQNFWKHALIKGGLAMLIAVLVLRRRELAAVIV